MNCHRIIRFFVLLLAASALSACSTADPGGESAMAVLPNAALDRLANERVTGKRACQNIEKWYEGFFRKAVVHRGAEEELQKAVTAQQARLRRRGYKSFALKDRKTRCVPTYPIGFKEWKCFASAMLCAGGR